MERVRSLQRSYGSSMFWAVSGLITTVCVTVLPDIYRDLLDSARSEDTLFTAGLFLICIFGTLILPFALWQHYQRAKFLGWLTDNWAGIESGIRHPDGYEVNLDTPLVKYTVVFSAILATVSFESRPYVYSHRSAGSSQVAFTLFSAIFGWWYLSGLDGVVNTVKALHNNLSSANVYSLRDLLASQ